ncbi:thioredoxin [Neobacillus notoginsengisoli]|uniref:Thioredoxin n=1 Tax=Neobacillus notoginsengisoli TaxID=1578198 RepID=A0A417YQQ7_9BACI|nr:thioredoxin family protein [Neobacillus notoginsengisoli]RHW36056.1 thioredoxin [Neobacillus notoginsengisoli]
MKKSALFLTLNILLVGCQQEDVPQTEKKVVLNEKTKAQMQIDKTLPAQELNLFYQKNAILGNEIEDREKGAYLVYFYSPSCPICKRFSGVIKEYENQKDAYSVYKVDLSNLENAKIREKYKIDGAPTWILFDGNEKKELNRGLGLMFATEIPLKQK